MTLILLTVALGIVSGISEGIVMIQWQDWGFSFKNVSVVARCRDCGLNGGVREHKWFRWYHVIDVAAYLLCAALAVVLWNYPPHVWFAVGLGVLLWECREIGYNFSRYNTVLAKSENVYGIGIEITGIRVVIAHGVRTVVSLVFLYGGVR